MYKRKLFGCSIRCNGFWAQGGKFERLFVVYASAVWPAPTASSDTCQRRCRDTSQQTNITDADRCHFTQSDNTRFTPDTDTVHSNHRRQASPPRIKSEHLSPPMMTSSSRDHVTSRDRKSDRDRVGTSQDGGEGCHWKSDESVDRKLADRDGVVTSSYGVTSRGTSPLDVTLQCAGDDVGSRGAVTSPERDRRPLSFSLSTQPACDNDTDGSNTGTAVDQCSRKRVHQLKKT